MNEGSGEMETESNNVDSLEVVSSRGDIVEELDCRIKIFDKEIRELGSFLLDLQTDVVTYGKVVSSFKQLGDGFREMAERLQDCGESLERDTTSHGLTTLCDSEKQIFGLIHRIMYGPCSSNIPIESTIIDNSRVSRDTIVMHTSWRSNSDIACATSDYEAHNRFQAGDQHAQNTPFTNADIQDVAQAGVPGKIRVRAQHGERRDGQDVQDTGRITEGSTRRFDLTPRVQTQSNSPQAAKTPSHQCTPARRLCQEMAMKAVEDSKKKSEPKLVKLDRSFKLAEQWVVNMSASSVNDKSALVELEGRPARLGIGATVPRESKVMVSNDPVERKLLAKLNANKRKVMERADDPEPSERNTDVGEESEEDESESKTKMFGKKRPMSLTPTVIAKRKHA
ncbi:hypothetical protein F511_21153 [Dorcoceras hygrometricum]|uniref:WIT1/2 N-terminal helical bundle domain-containing protein n=1 Tax=Dorcoceras hygrometricum TaxID=472368 RepID=A0A2Z7AAG3_9LAMI|nr:hypothetical protein F511_21153 [Dorcoceras hygrometricum]